jgi:uncharacterized membrane protein YvlD (DUF360 family)
MFVTSFWDSGFILPIDSMGFVKAALALTILFVLVQPLMKVVFLPLNLITFGLFSFAVYIFFLHILASAYGLFTIKAWDFAGITLPFVTLPKTHISYMGNLVLSSFSLSSIINLLDNLT